MAPFALLSGSKKIAHSLILVLSLLLIGLTQCSSANSDFRQLLDSSMINTNHTWNTTNFTTQISVQTSTTSITTTLINDKIINNESKIIERFLQRLQTAIIVGYAIIYGGGLILTVLYTIWIIWKEMKQSYVLI